MSTFPPERRCKSTDFLRSLQIFGEFFLIPSVFSFRSVHYVIGSGVLIGVLHDVRFAGSDERKRDFEGRSALFVTGCIQLGAEMQAFGICSAESDAAENLILGAVGREIGASAFTVRASSRPGPSSTARGTWVVSVVGPDEDFPPQAARLERANASAAIQ